MSALWTRDKSDLGRTKEALSQSLRKDISMELMAGSCVMSQRSVCLEDDEIAAL